MPATSGSRTRSTIGRAWLPSTTRSAAAVMPRCASAATVTAAPCAPSPTACCRWPAPCSNSRRCSTPATRFAMPPVREHPPPIPLFDRKPPRPDLPPGKAPRAAAVKDAAENAAASAEPAQSVLDGASTVLPFALEAPHHDGVSRGYRPALFRLIIGGRSAFFVGDSILLLNSWVADASRLDERNLGLVHAWNIAWRTRSETIDP